MCFFHPHFALPARSVKCQIYSLCHCMRVVQCECVHTQQNGKSCLLSLAIKSSVWITCNDNRWKLRAIFPFSIQWMSEREETNNKSLKFVYIKCKVITGLMYGWKINESFLKLQFKVSQIDEFSFSSNFFFHFCLIKRNIWLQNIQHMDTVC